MVTVDQKILEKATIECSKFINNITYLDEDMSVCSASGMILGLITGWKEGDINEALQVIIEDPGEFVMGIISNK